MYFYIVMFVFCVVMFILNNLIKDEKQKKLFEVTTLIILCIISGTRYYLGGTDYYVYEKTFNVLPEISEFDFSTVHNIYETFGMEKGYLFFCSLIKTIGFNFFGFTLIHSIIFYTCMYIGLKRYTKNFNLLIIIFLYKLFFYNTFISLRQSITIAVFFVSLKFIENKKVILYYLCCLVALTFHNGALLLFVIYFINKIKLTKKRLIILNCIFIPTILLSILRIPILEPFQEFINLFDEEVTRNKASSLINNDLTVGISLLHTMEYFIIMFLVIVNYSKMCEKNPKAEFIIKLFIMLLPIFTLFRGYIILTREKDYFLFTYAIIIEMLCEVKKQKYAMLIQLATILVCFYGFCRFIISFDNGGMVPYQSYLTKNISIIGEK